MSSVLECACHTLPQNIFLGMNGIMDGRCTGTQQEKWHSDAEAHSQKRANRLRTSCTHRVNSDANGIRSHTVKSGSDTQIYDEWFKNTMTDVQEKTGHFAGEFIDDVLLENESAA